jgi:hypothetical protein
MRHIIEAVREFRARPLTNTNICLTAHLIRGLCLADGIEDESEICGLVCAAATTLEE